MKFKNNYFSFFYELGMILSCSGFVFPVFKNSMTILDKTVVFYSMRIFDFLTKDDLLRTSLLLLVLICSIAGLTVNLLKTSEKKILKFAFIIVSILSGIIFYLITTDIFIQYREHFYMGLYCIIAGWIFSIIGIFNIMVTKK